MGYLISQIGVSLVIAILLGFAFGWALGRLFPKQARFAEWQTGGRAADQSRDLFQNEPTELARRFEALSAEHAKCPGIIQRSVETVTDQEARISKLEAEFGESLRGISSAHPHLLEHSLESTAEPDETGASAERDDEVAQRFQTQIDELKDSIIDWQEKSANLADQLKERDARIVTLKNAGVDNARGASDKQAKIVVLERDLSDWKSKYALLARRVSRSPSTETDQQLLKDPAETDAASDRKDDLKAIYGIGRVLEKTLNEMGIYRFRQIADFSNDEIRRIADKLKTFPGRIERDRWVDQAKDLESQKHD